MNPTLVALAVFGGTFCAALSGMALRRRIPAMHFDTESRDSIKVGVGMIVTMTALVLGLVTASAKSNYDAAAAAVEQMAVDMLVLDRTLARYGPETGAVRAALKDVLAARIEMVWPREAGRPVVDPTHGGFDVTVEAVAPSIGALQPATDGQRALQARAIGQAETLLKDRWLVLAATKSSIPLPFIAVLLAWLVLIFASFGLLAPRNATVVVTLFVCALSVASAIFLVLEMESPFDGLLRVPPDSLLYTLARLGR